MWWWVWWVGWVGSGCWRGSVGWRGAVEPRSISWCGMIFGPRSRERSSFLTAIRPISSSGCAMVLSGGCTCRAVEVLSKPRTETSSGTRRPRCCSSLTTAAPISSLMAKMAVRPGFLLQQVVQAGGAAFVEEAAGGGDRGAVGFGHGAEVAAFPGLGDVDGRGVAGEQSDAAVAELQQVTGCVVGCLFVVDGHAGGAGLVADGHGDDGDVRPEQLPWSRA